MSHLELTREEREALLERARRRCFFLDVDDAGARLCRANMPFGIAKIHWLQEALGHAADATYVSTPDSTVTRNDDRWAAGFGYGGVIEWSGDLVPLELKPNCCGMLVAGLRDRPEAGRLREAVGRLAESGPEVEGVRAEWDMDQSNHFVNLYEVSDPAATGGCPWVVVMHSSGKELRRPNQRGPGLYLEGRRTPGSLDELAEVLDTPFGPGVIVRGAAAARYLAYVAEVERFARARREAYASALLGDGVEVLFNRTHQTMDRPGRMLLGCYSVGDGEVPWVPLTLRPELPAYLVAPGEIYAEAVLAREGLAERAREQGCLDRLLGAGLLPHGGGYAYPAADGQAVELEDGGPAGARRFRFAGDPEWFASVRALAFSYRGEAVLRRILSLESGRVAARLDPLGSLQG